MTAGVLAALRGDEMRSDVAMTGTVNPDGTVGPVGGIPHKIDGAVKAGMKLVLIPYGKRYGMDMNTGKPVDLFQRGKSQGVEVKAVGDIYSAYEQLTGVKLPRAEPARAPSLDVDMYQRVVVRTMAWLEEFKKLEAVYAKTPAKYRTDEAKEMMKDARESVKLAERLIVEGQAPAAFEDAFEAAQAAAVASELDRTLWVADKRGMKGAKDYVRKNKLEERWKAALEGLKNYEPKTLSATGVLLHGYSTLIQGMAIHAVGDALIDGRFAFPMEGTKEERDAAVVFMAAVFYQVAKKNYENIADVLDVAGHVKGRAMPADAPLVLTKWFFDHAAVANLNQFEKNIIVEEAQAKGIPVEKMKRIMMQRDQAYLIVRFANDEAFPKLLRALEGHPAAPYAILGGTIQTYTMSSRLMAEHYSLGVLRDDDGNVTGVRKEASLKYMLDFSEDQLRRNIQVLRDHDVEPMASVFFCQVGSNLRGRGLEDRLGALVSFWQANVQARALAYLGGFAAPDEAR